MLIDYNEPKILPPRKEDTMGNDEFAVQMTKILEGLVLGIIVTAILIHLNGNIVTLIEQQGKMIEQQGQIIELLKSDVQ